MGRWSYRSQGQRPQEKAALLTPWSWTSSPQTVRENLLFTTPSPWYFAVEITTNTPGKLACKSASDVTKRWKISPLSLRKRHSEFPSCGHFLAPLWPGPLRVPCHLSEPPAHLCRPPGGIWPCPEAAFLFPWSDLGPGACPLNTWLSHVSLPLSLQTLPPPWHFSEKCGLIFHSVFLL